MQNKKLEFIDEDELLGLKPDKYLSSGHIKLIGAIIRQALEDYVYDIDGWAKRYDEYCYKRNKGNFLTEKQELYKERILINLRYERNRSIAFFKTSPLLAATGLDGDWLLENAEKIKNLGFNTIL